MGALKIMKLGKISKAPKVRLLLISEVPNNAL